MGKCALSLTAVLFVLPQEMHKVLSCFSSSLSLIMECFLWAVSSWLTKLFTLSVLRNGKPRHILWLPGMPKGWATQLPRDRRGRGRGPEVRAGRVPEGGKTDMGPDSDLKFH